MSGKVKVHTFEFADGKMEVKEGETVFMADRPGRNGGGAVLFIQKIGRDLITLALKMDSARPYAQFYKETGRQKTDYMGSTLYSSKDAYDRLQDEAETISAVEQRFQGWGKRKITYKQALRIKAILDEET